jgi:hypothetical protein
MVGYPDKYSGDLASRLPAVADYDEAGPVERMAVGWSLQHFQLGVP